MIHLTTYALWLAAAGWTVYLPGRCLEVRFFALPEGPSKFFARWVLGFALWTALLLAMAMTGLYSPIPLLSLALGVLLLSHLAALHLAVKTPLFSHPMKARTGEGKGASAVTTGLGAPAGAVAVLFPLFCITVNPTVSWDAAVYHLTLPRLYLEHGGFRLVEMNVYSHFPHAVELFFGAAMAVKDHVLAKAFHFGFGVLVAAGLMRLVGGAAGLLSAALFALNGVVILEWKIAYIDLAHAFFLLAGCYLASRTAGLPEGRGGELRRAMLLTGLAAGLLAGVKVTGIVSAAILALILLPRWARELALFGRRRAAASVLAFAVPMALLWAPWLIKSWWWTGNPVYPLAYGLFGGPDWSPELGRQLGEWQRGIGMGRGLLDYLLLPLRVILSGGEGYARFDGEIGWFWLLAGPVALLALRRPGLERHMAGVATLHAVWWAASSQQMRFLIPALTLYAAAGALSLRQLTRRWPRTGRRLLAATCLLTLAATAAASHGKVLAAGWRHFDLYLRPGFDPLAQSPRPPIFDAVAHLPEDARLLLLNTNHGFFCHREYLADSFFEASQISDWLRTADSPAQVRAKLAERGVSHLMLDTKPLGVRYPQPLLDLVGDPRWVTPVAEQGRFLLLELRP